MDLQRQETMLRRQKKPPAKWREAEKAQGNGSSALQNDTVIHAKSLLHEKCRQTSGFVSSLTGESFPQSVQISCSEAPLQLT